MIGTSSIWYPLSLAPVFAQGWPGNVRVCCTVFAPPGSPVAEMSMRSGAKVHSREATCARYDPGGRECRGKRKVPEAVMGVEMSWPVVVRVRVVCGESGRGVDGKEAGRWKVRDCGVAVAVVRGDVRRRMVER